MKLKEKLAEEYARATVRKDCPTTGDWVNISHDYLQGFEKAREMAAERIKASIQAEGNKEFDDWVINQRLQAKRDHAICLTLGEEEIET